MANRAEEKAQTTRLAERACQIGGAVCAISITCAQAQLPNWTWIFVVTAAFGAAAFCSGGLFLLLDGLRAIPKFGEKRAEIIKRGYYLFGSTMGFAAVALVTFLYFPPAARLFNHAERGASAKTAPSTTPNPSTANNAKVGDGVAPSQPNQPPNGAGAPPTTSPAAGTSAAATTTPPATPPTPSPRRQEAPIVEETEFVSLYGNTPRTLCGQPRLSARPSSLARPSPTGWLLYSTDHLSGFQERPLVYGEPVRFGTCTLILEQIDPDLPRFDFKVINRE